MSGLIHVITGFTGSLSTLLWFPLYVYSRDVCVDQRQTSGHSEGADRLPVLLSVLGRPAGCTGGLPRCQEGLRENGSAQLRWWTCVRPKNVFGTFFYCAKRTGDISWRFFFFGHELDVYSSERCRAFYSDWYLFSLISNKQRPQQYRRVKRLLPYSCCSLALMFGVSLVTKQERFVKL